jgi:drug/metabolite transporter (DMT)-like permease
MKSRFAEKRNPAPPAAMEAHRGRIGLLYVCIAVFFFGTSPVFVRWSAPFSAVEIAFWRLAIAALLVFIFGKVTRQRLLLRREEVPRFIFYGLVTALHFFFYVASLNYTTIAHSLSIVYTSPIFVAILSTLVLGEPLRLRKYISIGVVIVGIAVLTGFEPHYTTCISSGIGHGQCMILGDALALLSALCYAVYTIVGRGERARHPLFRYTTNVYAIAAAWLLPLELVLAFQHTYPLPAVSAVIALGVLPLGFGHTLYNASVRNIHATVANLIATQEVTLGVLLGVIFVHEIPTVNEIIGALVILAGIAGVLI